MIERKVEEVVRKGRLEVQEVAEQASIYDCAERISKGNKSVV